jgi:hypothetical protein
VAASTDTATVGPIAGWILGWWLGRLKRIDYDVTSHLAVNECDPAAGDALGDVGDVSDGGRGW